MTPDEIKAIEQRARQRKTLVDTIKIAGFHGDKRWFTRLVVEHRIDRRKAQDAYEAGQRAYQTGVPCWCFRCKEADKLIEGES